MSHSKAAHASIAEVQRWLDNGGPIYEIPAAHIGVLLSIVKGESQAAGSLLADVLRESWAQGWRAGTADQRARVDDRGKVRAGDERESVNAVTPYQGPEL